jgi:inorganic pyrophosphatase
MDSILLASSNATSSVQLDETGVHLIIVLPALLGLLWSAKEWRAVDKCAIDGKIDGNEPLVDRAEIVEKMLEISGVISDGAMSFLTTEYLVMLVYVAVFGIILFFVTNLASAIAFVVGALTSIVCGWIGMKIAVFTNVRTAHESWRNLSAGFEVAMKGGCVMGLSLVSIGVLALYMLIILFQMPALNATFAEGDAEGTKLQMYEALAGYGLGGSSIALFGRVGGGIYTKAADVGADLSGKNKWNLNEDDPRNPGCIADNVGDNVGDIAGMGADLFGSFAESTCAALVLAASNAALKTELASLLYPVLLSSAGIAVGWLTLIVRPFIYRITNQIADNSVEKALKGVLVISTFIMSGVSIYLSKICLPKQFEMESGTETLTVLWWHCALAVNLGLWSGLIIGYVTEYYTSHSYAPVRSIVENQKQSAATGIILGLALGYLSCIVPTICLGITILVAHSLAGMFGVALGALGMLGTMTMGLTIDAYGPISDNAGGIAEMCGLPEEVRERTDCLDAAGNTTAAIGKGFAIGSAALVSLALFGAFTVRANIKKVDVLDPWVFTGLLFGAMMPYAFAAMTMKSVGMAANSMVKECNEQFDKMFDLEVPRQKFKEAVQAKAAPALPEYAQIEAIKLSSDTALDVLNKLNVFARKHNLREDFKKCTIQPDYGKCIKISTDASLWEMILPGALVILSPLVAGFGFGKNACAGMLSGALVSAVQLAISMSNTGGAWDNSKKFISAGGADGKDDQFRKGSEAHSNSVTGDTVGDPLKDTSGPALNIVMKLTAIISLVFGTAIAQSGSNCSGGPKWVEASC